MCNWFKITTTKKTLKPPQWHEDIKKQWRCSGFFMPFLGISFLNFGKCCRLGLLVIKLQTNKNYEALMQIIPYLPNDSNYNMKRNLYWIYKVKWLSALSKHLWSLLRLSFCKNNFFTGKKASGKYFSGHHWYFKCTKAESCTDIKFKATLYCLSVTVEDINL